MKAIILNGTVIALGNYTNEQFPDCLFIDVDSEQELLIKSLKLPKYNGSDFLDGHTDDYEKTIQLEIETKKYIKRSKDGCDAYAAISAEFRLAKLSGQISEETHSVIERTLIPVRNEVLAGQWISAKNELILIGNTIIGQQLYDRLLNQITNYISENY